MGLKKKGGGDTAKQKSSKLQQLPEVCASRDADPCGCPTGRVQHHPRCPAQNRLLSAAVGDAAHKGSWHLSSCLATYLIISAPSAVREMLLPCDEDAKATAWRYTLRSPLVSGEGWLRAPKSPPCTKAHTASCLAVLVLREKGIKKGKQEI